ncbi:leucine-rich repeat and fibronectin type-III domain-containing protein 4-like [Anguilla anguilla]|nr:leucine-rich repeat and fibronectin type-III domain-containing protein 4-like [Anguilla anguilla]
MPNSPPPEPAPRQTRPSGNSTCPPHPKTPHCPTPRQTRPSKLHPARSRWVSAHEAPPPSRALLWLVLLGGVSLLAPPVSGGETWGVVSMCPSHCVCRNLSESLSTLCVNKGLLFVPPDIDRRTVELRLADNFIPELGASDFSNMSGLVDLTLSRNTLHRLRPLAFSDLESLRSLHLDANRLTGVGPRDLAGLPNLQHLILNNNQLSAIAPHAFAHFLPTLEDLDLSYNNLREAPWSALRSMASLHTLNLDHNLIERIPAGAFRDLARLGRLDVTSNRLRTLPPGPAPQPPVSGLSFGGNPLHCNCQLLWLRRLSRTDAMETCATPAHLAGRYFWALAEAELACEPPLISRHTPLLWVLEGQRATLRCRALGDPPPLVHWVAPGDRVVANSSRVRVHGNGTLDVLVARPRDDGAYACIAVNAAGEASAAVRLHVVPLPHHHGNRSAPPPREREPSDISAGRGGAGGPGNGTAGEEAGPGGPAGGRVGVLEVTATTAQVRWYLGGASLDYLPWMYQIQYNSTADETLMYRILPPSSSSFQLKNLVSAADYSLCVLAVFDQGAASLSSTRVLGCAAFSTKDDFPRCRTLHAHFLGGALSVLVGGAVVVMLLVFTVATMVRHHQQQWVCGSHGDRGTSHGAGGGVGEGDVEGAGPPLPTKGTSVYSQTNGEGTVMTVVLPKNKHKPMQTTPKDLSDPPDRGGAGRRFPPYSPESERVTLYYPAHASATLPSKLRRAGPPRGGATAGPALPDPGPLRSNRSCSFDMGEVATTTCYGYGKRLGMWTRQSPSLQSMLVPCGSATSMASGDSGAHAQEHQRTYDTCATGPAHNANNTANDELEESVV